MEADIERWRTYITLRYGEFNAVIIVSFMLRYSLVRTTPILFKFCLITQYANG